MDAKITKLRLSRMFSYDWFKIVLSAAALIAVWVLIFTMTATSILPSQKFTVMNYFGNVALNDGEFYDKNKAAFEKGVFSYEVIESSVEDLAQNSGMVNDLLQARMAVEEGDVVFVADDYDSRDVTEEKVVDGDETQYKYTFGDTYLQNFLQMCFYNVYDVNVYLNEMRVFVGQYYEESDYKTPSELNKQKIKDDFNARTKKDKRFKKAAARAQGEKDEIERIQKYRDALVKFEWYLENGVVILPETVIVKEFFTDGSDLKGTYSINLCPTKGRGGATVENGKPAMSKLMNAFAYKPLVETEKDGKTVLEYGDATANNMSVCLFKFGGVGNGFQYESLSYIVSLIEEYVHADMRCPEYVYA